MARNGNKTGGAAAFWVILCVGAVWAEFVTCTDLIRAIRASDVDLVRTMVDERGPEIAMEAEEGTGVSPLDAALQSGDAKNAEIAEIIAECLDATAVNELLKNGRHPLHVAIGQNMDNVVYILVEKGANKMFRDANRITALHLAIKGNRADMVDDLLEDEKLCSWFLEAVDNQGRTAMHWAAIEGNVVIVESLLEKMSSTCLLIPDLDGRVPLHYAFTGEIGGDIFMRIRLLELLSQNVQWDVFDMVDLRQETPLHMLARRWDVPQIAAFLQRKGVPINSLNENNETALDIAEACGRPLLAEYLRSQGGERGAVFAPVEYPGVEFAAVEYADAESPRGLRKYIFQFMEKFCENCAPLPKKL